VCVREADFARGRVDFAIANSPSQARIEGEISGPSIPA
jgi:hypothetical protein